MAEPPNEKSDRDAINRIQFSVPDTTTSSAQRHELTRRRSVASNLSIHTVSTHADTNVDRDLQLPVAYRTVSIRIDDDVDRERAEIIKENADEIAEELRDMQWHILSPPDLYERLTTSFEAGLSDTEITERLSWYGPNVPTPPQSRWLQKLLMYCFGGFGSLLLIGGILCLIAWRPLGNPAAPANAALGIVLIIVFFIQAGFNAWQDWSSGRVMKSISDALPEDSSVVREGKRTTVGAKDLVPGDVVAVGMGDKIPADMRLVEASQDLKFDRSVLTGESKPLAGTTEATEENYLETMNIALQGTHCVSGRGVGVVVDTGDTTVFGRIARLSSRPRKGLTNLQREILRFVIVVVSLVVVVVLLVIILWAAWLRKDHEGWIDVPLLIVDCVSVAVAFIPEGLPITLTTCLTITARSMKANKILCKSLATVETLGSVDLICSDKTGTLTKNKMFVTDFCVGASLFTVPHREAASPAVMQLQAVAGMCNAGQFEPANYALPLSERKIAGDATDQAILRFAEGLQPVSMLWEKWQKVYELSFNSKNKFMLTIVESTSEEDEDSDDTTTYTLLMKGAPDVLLSRCSTVLLPDDDDDDDTTTLLLLTDSWRQKLQQIQIQWALEGKRVLLLAQRVLPKSYFPSTDPTSTSFADAALAAGSVELTIVGHVGIVDPPREEIPDVIRTLRGAGIRVFMVTGDFKLTAQSIARQCGILRTPEAEVDDFTSLDRLHAPKESLEAVRGSGPGSGSGSGSGSGDSDQPDFSGALVLEGPELVLLNSAQWDQLFGYSELIFARTTPEQKLRIVREFQQRHSIVAMTGDGVNDAPSLRAADVGIALGSGSAVAIAAADMVLLDSFTAIVSAVRSGRVVFSNLRKTITYLLPAGSFSELWPVLINVLFGLPQNLSSFLMIVICCFTDCAGAMTLAYEQPEADILTRGPRNTRTQHLVDAKLLVHAYGCVGVMECACSMAMSFWHMQRRGLPFSVLWLGYGHLPSTYDPDWVTRVVNEGSSIYFVTLVVMQFFNLLATRTRRLSLFQMNPLYGKDTRNLWLFPAVVFAIIVVFIFCYIPTLQRVLGTTEIPVEYWFLPAAYGVGLLVLDEGRKAGVRRWPEGVLARWAW